MPMLKDLIKIISSPVRLSSRTKTKERRMLGMAVSTLFPQDQNALGVKKLNEVELERKEISTKFDEANQTIGALRFENNFLAEKTKKLEAELFQVRARLERTSIAKVDEMFSL